MSVEDASKWKPAPATYARAARRCGVDPAQMLLEAVHPWGINSAARAGMATGWVNRSNRPYPGYFRDPTYVDATASTTSPLPTHGLSIAAGRPPTPNRCHQPHGLQDSQTRPWPAVVTQD